ncbi:MAG TPA: hypothetical protein VIH57_04420 [Bacteroidales bacterium]
MKKNDKVMDKLTASRIKNLGVDVPSPDFTLKVMQTVVSIQPAYAVKQRKYWWALVFVPVIIGIAWYSIIFFKLTGVVSQLWTFAISEGQGMVMTVISLFSPLKHLDLPPFLVVGFIAILLLLTIEELLKRAKQSS